jgi:hypothetical protein
MKFARRLALKRILGVTNAEKQASDVVIQNQKAQFLRWRFSDCD